MSISDHRIDHQRHVEGVKAGACQDDVSLSLIDQNYASEAVTSGPPILPFGYALARLMSFTSARHEY
jgi:hypothetical protein